MRLVTWQEEDALLAFSGIGRHSAKLEDLRDADVDTLMVHSCQDIVDGSSEELDE